MKVAAALILAIWAVAVSRGQAQQIDPSCDSGPDQLAKCLNRELENEEIRLNTLYDLVVRMFNAGTINPTFWSFYDEPKELAAAEAAWLQFRDAQCTAETTMIGPLSASGVILATGECTLKMTRERIAYLQKVSDMIGHYSKLCATSPDACRLK